MKWSILLSRPDVDLPTICGIDKVFFRLVREFSGSKEELFFTHFRDKQLTHYIAVDAQELGRSLYKKYFASKKQIEVYYKEGIDLIKSTERKSKDTRDLRKALAKFHEDFETICNIYSIISWVAIEAWQKDFPIPAKPWKKTAIMELQEKLAKSVSACKLADEYQFLRSWTVIWHKPIDEQWIKDLKLNLPLQEFGDDLAAYITFFKDWRDDIRRKFVYIWSPFTGLLKVYT